MAATLEISTEPQVWNLDVEHSEVGFSVKHMMFANVKGSFRKVSGRITIDPADITKSSVEAEIDAASIETRSEQRDGHLRSADFFDVEKFPTLTFRSTRVDALSNKEFNVTGDLTIRDVTKQVVLHVTETGRGTDPWGGQRAGFSATTAVDRTAFGLTWNAALETGGVLVGNDIKILIEVEAVLG